MTQDKIHGDRPSTPRIDPLPPGERDAESRLLIDSIGSSGTDNTFDTLIRRQWMPFTVAEGALNRSLSPMRPMPAFGNGKRVAQITLPPN